MPLGACGMRSATDVNRYDEPTIHRQRVALIALAQAMLRGEVGVLDGCQRMLGLASRAAVEEHDPDLIVFHGIHSQEDHLPIGSVRQYWNAEALARADLEIAEAEDCHRPAALAACESLLRRLRTT